MAVFWDTLNIIEYCKSTHSTKIFELKDNKDLKGMPWKIKDGQNLDNVFFI